ncbi:MAG: response regulator, partial [Proteobacteria bacterium]|nr:response regulator [Pseudomonadota bacterium]
MSVFIKNNKAIFQIMALGVFLFNVLFGCLFYFNEKRDFKNYAMRASFMIAHQFVEMIDPEILDSQKKNQHMQDSVAFFKKNAKEVGLLNIAIFDSSGRCLLKKENTFGHIDPSLLEDKEMKVGYFDEYQALYGVRKRVYVASVIVNDIEKSPYIFKIDLDMTKEYTAAMDDVLVYTSVIFLLTFIFFALLFYSVQFFSKRIQNYCGVIESQKNETEKLAHIQHDFFTTIAHELRTPINGFLGSIELLKETKVTKKQTELLEVADFSAKHLLGILNELLDFSKLENGKIVLELIDFNLLQNVLPLIEMNQILAKKKNITFERCITLGDDFWVKSDPLRLNQILQNLLSNAIKFTPQNGKITFSIVHDLDHIIFEVKDTGIGIEKEKIGTLFQKYTQIKDSTTRLYGGTGLGLSIVKNLVTLLNGKIDVESEEGGGSTFRVTLPLKRIEGFKEDEAKILNTALGDIKKILVVDDNLINQMILKGYLEKQKHHVETASSGKEALLKVKETHFDIVFMDISMP